MKYESYRLGYYSYPSWGENPYKPGSVDAWLWAVGHHTAFCNIPPI